jgi:hypothetical protein
MDKEVLALIGKLYVEIYTLSNFSEGLKLKISDLEKQLAVAQTQANDLKKTKV